MEGGLLPPFYVRTTVASIDSTIDSHNAKTYLVFLWLFVILIYFIYLAAGRREPGDFVGCSGNAVDVDVDARERNVTVQPTYCIVINSVINWIIVSVLSSTAGAFFIYSATVGNLGTHFFGSKVRSIITSIASFILVSLVSSITFVVVQQGISGSVQVAARFFINFLQLAFALVLLGMLIAKMIAVCVRRSGFSTRSGMIELSLRQVGLKKLEMLVQNALDVHGDDVTTTYSSSVLQTSSANSARSRFIRESHNATARTGGFLATWRDIMSGRCLKDEGIFLFNRIVIGTVAQFIATLHLIIYIGDLTPENDAETEGNEASLWSAHGVGLLLSAIACFYATFSHIPSAVSTIRQLRTGALPSMRDPHFLRYRAAQDTPSLLLGGMFWGIWYTGFFVYFFIGLLVTVLLFTGQTFVAGYIAFTVTALGKLLILRLVRTSTHKAFHRRNPRFANVWILCLEAWNLGLGYGYMAIRAIKLIVVSVLSIARFDIQVLSSQINTLGPLEIDDHPTIFRRDLLAHEAHRHPYLEILGILYVKSLQDINFGSRAHSAWRRLFVLALLPWMNKDGLVSNS